MADHDAACEAWERALVLHEEWDSADARHLRVRLEQVRQLGTGS
jgi:hypothetical protein